ncbi:AAA family ATPase [Pseudomonas sp.]|uniref:AAA family ATPase n=1 Tax=Pseudomonas sp. TaxID=306 RepID=UPI003CC6D341
MINRILLRNVSSYSPTSVVTIAELKRVNIFYGQNGTGKTTISSYLQSPSDARFNQCLLDPVKIDREILVYNHIFMERNFHEVASQPGVFTLNEGNIEAAKAITMAEQAISSLTTTHDAHIADGSQAKAAQEAARDKLKENAWKLKGRFDNSALAYCFSRLNTKDRLIEAASRVALASTADTAEGLLAEAAELQGASDVELPSIPRLRFESGAIEADPILTEVITGAGDSYLSALIQELGNSDWVKHALRFESHSKDQCPLCQQPLQGDFYAELYKVFDQTYEKRLTALTKLQQQYTGAAERLLRQIEAPIYNVESIQIHVANLRAVLQKNIQALAIKVANPSTIATLDATDALVASLDDAINVEQHKIDEINAKIRHKQAHMNSIKDRFWVWFRKEYEPHLAAFDDENQLLTQQREAARNRVVQISEEIRAQRDIITESRAETTNVDQSVENINQWLHVLGLKGFELIKEEGAIPQYRLHRPGQTDGVFKTLSEGEKTLISFLYFLEVCNGELNAAGGGLKSERIIVIDDPISSLSHNYVYDIASLIRRWVLSPKTRFKQIIILTHNLFFFHEMQKLLKDDKEDSLALFRITKADYSTVIPMREREIQNDYQAFWQTLKDALNGSVSPNVIPNVMRNILEHYFTFVHQKDSLRQALQELGDENPQFRALYRYVNRESHADSMNLTDFGEIDPRVFIERFKDVFIKTNFEGHFDKMMA